MTEAQVLVHRADTGRSLADGAGENTLAWVYDGLHPSDKGHQRIADMLVKIMKKY